MHKGILVVDDSKTIRGALIREIKKHISIPDGDIMECSDGKEAIHIMTEHTICALITDLEMPNVDGNQLVEKLKKNSILAKKAMIVYTSKPDEVNPQLKVSPGVLVFDKNDPTSMPKIIEILKNIRDGK